MPKYYNLIEEVSEKRPLEYDPTFLREYPDTDMEAGRPLLSKAKEAAMHYGGRAVEKAKEYGGHAVELAKAHPYAAAGAGLAAAAAGGLAARAMYKRRAAKVGAQKAQGEMAKARSHMRRLSPSQKKMVSKRGSALRAKMEHFAKNYGEVGVNALAEAVLYQYHDMYDLKETPVTVVADLVEQTLLEKWGKIGAGVGAAAGAAHAGRALGHAGYLDHGVSSVGELGDAALVVGGSVLVGAAVGALLGKGAQWIAKAVKKGMSREQATKTMAKAKKKLQSDSAFAAKARRAVASKKKKRR